MYIYILLYILFHYGLSQGIDYSSLCYTVGPCLAILYIIVCLCCPKLPILPFPTPPLPWKPQVCFLYESIFVSQICSFVSYFIFFNFNWVYLTSQSYVSGVQSKSTICIHISIPFEIPLLYRSLQNIEYISLYSTVGPCCLSVLYVVACIHQFQLPNLSLSILHVFPLVNISLVLKALNMFLFYKFYVSLLLGSTY